MVYVILPEQVQHSYLIYSWCCRDHCSQLQCLPGGLGRLHLYIPCTLECKHLSVLHLRPIKVSLSRLVSFTYSTHFISLLMATILKEGTTGEWGNSGFSSMELVSCEHHNVSDSTQARYWWWRTPQPCVNASTHATCHTLQSSQRNFCWWSQICEIRK